MAFLLGAIICSSLVCLGLYLATGEGMILEGVAKWLDDTTERGLLPSWVSKPLLLCPLCMASIWGTKTYWALQLAIGAGVTWQAIVLWPISIIATVALNGFLHLVYLKFHGNVFRDRDEHNGSGLGLHSE